MAPRALVSRLVVDMDTNKGTMRPGLYDQRRLQSVRSTRAGSVFSKQDNYTAITRKKQAEK